ncbi:YcxB-like protein [Mucilaginibacter pineti]|uniref:YcxB-like protein n=1 Tax=Mucilaginibacter pineti TaxID=1391627 RepID=A0A1G7KA59_9SPHI|nr:YcxB family protein [Mucilaginibacter pineti]SDF33844.1 YcxB-like protein [Mucilaginibacter pineti]
MQDITIHSAIDFKTYFKIVLKMTFKPRLFITMLAVLIILEGAAYPDISFTWRSQEWILYYFILWFAIILPGALYLTSKRNMKRVATLREPLVYVINEDKIEVKGDTFSNTSNWQYISRLIEREKYFLLRTGVKGIHYLPKDGFELKEDIARLKQIVKEKGIKFSYK